MYFDSGSIHAMATFFESHIPVRYKKLLSLIVQLVAVSIIVQLVAACRTGNKKVLSRRSALTSRETKLKSKKMGGINTPAVNGLNYI